MKDTLYKLILAFSVITSLALVLIFFRPSLKVETEATTWNGEYMQVLSEPYLQTEVNEGFGKFDDIFGGMRPSNFKTTLSRSLGATASTSETIYTTSLTTKDSHVLTASDIGDVICFHINPGASNDEISCCTGITSTNFTGCTRGYNFYSTSTTSGNAKAHSPGETIVISNDDHYLSTQYPQVDSTATITGLWTFGGDNIASIQFGAGASTYDKRIYIYNGDANKPYIGYDESENAWVISTNGVDTTTIGATGGAYTAGDGLVLTASDFDVNIASSSGLYFYSDEYLAIYASTSNPLYIDDDGMVSGIEASSSYTMGSLTLVTPLDEIYGGLGTVSWDAGDMIYFSADNIAANLASSTEDSILSIDDGFPVWASFAKYQNVASSSGSVFTTTTASASSDWDGSDVASISIPANTIGKNGYLKLKIAGLTPNTGAGVGVSIRIKWSETALATMSFPSANILYNGEIIIFNANATNSQKYYWKGVWNFTNLVGQTGATAYSTATIDTTAATVLEVSDVGAGTADGTIDLISIEPFYSD
jgi:hypothetical protein